jgi:arabinose-5-phosphate isomerase
MAMFLPVEKELCPYNLVPTTSCAAQLLFGDALAIGLMQSKEFTVGDFAANHPAGLLGRKITARVADLMLKGAEVPLCSPNAKLIDVLHELSSKRCGCLLIADEKGALKGIFTDGDLRRAIQMKGPDALQMAISTLMTGSPKTISPERLALDAVRSMEEDPSRPVTVLPVVREGKMVGLVRMHDILQISRS